LKILQSIPGRRNSARAGNLICPVLAEHVFGGEIIRLVDEDRAVMILNLPKAVLKYEKERGTLYVGGLISRQMAMWIFLFCELWAGSSPADSPGRKSKYTCV
jgi:hypothetical protein